MMQQQRILVEACVDSVASARVAEAAGADRLEVCASLAEGGLTPSAGLIACCVESSRVPVHAMIRPRGGDFCYDRSERLVMRRDIAEARSLGVTGVVLGVLTVEGRIDVEATGELVSLSRPMSVTFHRAFDVVADLDEALEQAIETGADRLLTSGGHRTALDGVDRLTGLVRRAADRITLIAAGGIRAENVQRVLDSGVREVHARCAMVRKGASMRNPAIRFRSDALPEDAIEVIDEAAISRLVAAAL